MLTVKIEPPPPTDPEIFEEEDELYVEAAN
jgi:hypothetical protein